MYYYRFDGFGESDNNTFGDVLFGGHNNSEMASAPKFFGELRPRRRIARVRIILSLIIINDLTH